jgi:ribosomal protein L6P/L9E
MTHNKKRTYKIKIPKKIIALYNYKKNILTIIGPLKIKSLKLPFKLFISNNFIKISSIFCLKIISKKIVKKIYELQGTWIAIIKQTIIETLYDYYQKLKIVGVGY